jgi:hypothetical protein
MERTAPMPESAEPEVEALDEAVGHVRGPAGAHLLIDGAPHRGVYDAPTLLSALAG